MSFAIGAFVLAAGMLTHAVPTVAFTQSRPAAPPARNACSLITPQEMAGIVGTRIRDGEPQAVSEGTECRFRSSDGNWVHVALGPIDAKTFAQVRKLVGAQGENQDGVGDEAFFWGNRRIHVRVGTQTLIIGLPRNDDGNATTKSQVLALAKLGAPRLR
jgi:hypothetical protein